MALAAFGTDRFYRVAREDAFDLHDDGTFSLRVRPTGDGLTWVDRMVEFCPRRESGGPLTQDHYDLAWGVQKFTEEIVIHLARALHARTGRDRLAIAGGVGLNCVANEKILRETPFRRALRDAERQRSRAGGRRRPLRLPGRPRRQGAPSSRSRLPRSHRARSGDRRRARRRRRHRVSQERGHRERVRRAGRRGTHHRLGAGRRGIRAARARASKPSWRTLEPPRARSGSTARSSGANGSGRTPRASSPSTRTSTSRCSAQAPTCLWR